MKKKVLIWMMAITLALPIAGCGSKSDSGNTVKKETAQTDQQDDEDTFIEVTFPSTFTKQVDIGELQEEARSVGITDITSNQDGSLTMKMTEDTHKSYLRALKEGIDDSIQETLEEKNTFPSFEAITYNDDCTSFDIMVNSASYDEAQGLYDLVFFTMGNIYQSVNNVPEAEIKTTVNIKNKDTQEVIATTDSVSSADRLAGMQNEINSAE